MAWTLNTAFALMVASALIGIPGIGAGTPDYYDDDGDLNTGPTNLVGLSTHSDGEQFQLVLHVEAFDLEQAPTRYWWDFTADGTPLRWICDVQGSSGPMSISCKITERPFWRDSNVDVPVPERLDRDTALTDTIDDINAMDDEPLVEAEHSLHLVDSTLSFTATYKDLGVESGDEIILLEGGVHLKNHHAKAAEAAPDVMVVGEIVTLT